MNEESSEDVKSYLQGETSTAGPHDGALGDTYKYIGWVRLVTCGKFIDVPLASPWNSNEILNGEENGEADNTQDIEVNDWFVLGKQVYLPIL